jgi:starch synthase
LTTPNNPAQSGSAKSPARSRTSKKATETPVIEAQSDVTPAPKKPARKSPVKPGIVSTPSTHVTAARATKTKTAKPRATKPRASTPVTTEPAGLKVLFVASECAPYAKTGGLGDVVGGLSKALRALGHDARIVMPLYNTIDRHKYGIVWDNTSCIHMGNGEEQWVGVHLALLDGEVPVWFVEYDRFYARGKLYGDDDDAWRFGLLSKAATQLCKDKGWTPDVMHTHDWMTAPTNAFLKTWDRVFSPLSQTASVLTIHNIGYQGTAPTSVLGYYGIGGEYLTPDIFEDHGVLNLLKGGIYFADAITTVSPTHANEIMGPIGGQGLAPYLSRRYHDVFGILNGADYEHWDPALDAYLPARFSPSDMSGKAICKAELQERLGLEVRPDIPVVGIVSRFASQKGFDLMMEMLPMALGSMIFQVAVLGTGDKYTEDFFRWLLHSNPAVGGHIGFSVEMSHLIEAGSDFFLMPSLYEPCGLNQIYSLKYGTLPIVRATGGLDDTVQNYDEATGNGTGFKFWDISAASLYYTMGWAISTWYDRPHHYRQMQQQAMQQHFGWDNSAPEYVKVYEHAIRNRRRV